MGTKCTTVATLLGNPNIVTLLFLYIYQTRRFLRPYRELTVPEKTKDDNTLQG